jgi:DNA-binding IscR family transcriptional regulator
MNTQKILTKLKDNPKEIKFIDVMTAIESDYNFTATAFKNGQHLNSEGENSGSCKVFSFAILNNLEKTQTLFLFGQYYQDVLNTPEGTDHQNIREFMQHGFSGLDFSRDALSPK